MLVDDQSLAYCLSGKKGCFVANQRAPQRNDVVIRPIAKVQAFSVTIETNVQLDAMGSPRGWKLAASRRFEFPEFEVEGQVEVGFLEWKNHDGRQTARQSLHISAMPNRRLCTTVCAISDDHTLPHPLFSSGPIHRTPEFAPAWIEYESSLPSFIQ
jgi:hypothetical protein